MRIDKDSDPCIYSSVDTVEHTVSICEKWKATREKPHSILDCVLTPEL